jgi:hypothetical protein
MKLITIAAVLAAVAVPIAVQGAQAPAKAPPAKRTCTVNTTIGSRVNNVRSCMSAEERRQARAESRRTVDRIQSGKNGSGTMTVGAVCNAAGPRGC